MKNFVRRFLQEAAAVYEFMGPFGLVLSIIFAALVGALTYVIQHSQ
jgi:hypothetical protein